MRTTGDKKRVVLITDGDKVARKAVEEVAHRVGGRCISLSAGNPTPITGDEIISHILETPYDPVLVMLDDRGDRGQAQGEQALAEIVRNGQVEVLGVVAVASNTDHIRGVKVDCSITRDGELIQEAVDKDGYPRTDHSPKLQGDTVDVLNDYNIPIIVGVGDVGKMKGSDRSHKGAPITTRAVEEILARSGYQV
ncbi:stage V sporulation protein AE [Metallumcola ferriviriculae]|uniref:Stage V sporulation protein AE n=1 Tax=Metallumcola ferriviriculae TaxID=3039180 RepID=A0AAU0UR92_9FIRM|nr:stage V sporulation protein AE [Desulfitibacteraceae bacterium MK1]